MNMDQDRFPDQVTEQDFSRSGSVFGDLFRLGWGFWRNLLLGAVATPVIVFSSLYRSALNKDELMTPTVKTMIFIGSVITGAFLGIMLTLKDVVESRVADGKPVAIHFKLFFGYGIASLFVWFALFIVTPFVAAVLLDVLQ